MTTRIENETFDQERALYASRNLTVRNCRFDGPTDGESALKESAAIEVFDSFFNLRYPFWHVTGGKITSCQITENCRAALWYDTDIEISGCKMYGIKAIRECENVLIKDTEISSPEFIWKTKNLTAENINIMQSEYPFFEVEDSVIRNSRMKGKYSFQYCRNIEISNCTFDTKDAFWHSKDITIKDSVINGEYLGWYSENLKFINCRIAGTQPFCYCKNLILENCTMENCDLAFERSTVKADVRSRIDSIKNPYEAEIRAKEIGEVILEDSIVDRGKVKITTQE